jgi:hypothetical protein
LASTRSSYILANNFAPLSKELGFNRNNGVYMSKLFHDFSEWKSLTDVEELPKSQVIYVIRVVDENKKPISINRARAIDHEGIINIGSGKGLSRLKKLKGSFSSMKTTEDWHRWKHHQLVLWCLKYNFAELLNMKSIEVEDIEFCWLKAPDAKLARKQEKETILKYKSAYADIPIGNLKSW